MQPEYSFLKTSTLAIEGPLQISQAIKIPLLLNEEEMDKLLRVLLEEFPNLAFYNTSGVVKNDEGIIAPSEFGRKYAEYVALLQQEQIPCAKTFHAYFSSSLSLTSDVLYQIPVESSRIIKPNRPTIQLQPHHLVYSQDTGSLYSMAYSQDSIAFGIQLSYPNLFQDPHHHDVVDVDESEKFPNTILFKKIRLWIRDQTLPTPFMINGKKVNYPIRLGKNCFSWINNHPQLKKQNLYVQSRNS